MSEYLSNKIKFVSFFLMIVVVILHAPMYPYSTGVNIFIQKLMTSSLTRIAVPLFFIISGFLFFYKDSNVDFKFFLNKYKKRFRSIFVPYLIWTCLGLLLTYICVNIPYIYNKMNTISYGVFFLDPPKLLYQLWFLRDLIVCIILSPILYFCIKKAPIISIIALLYLGQFYFYIECSSLLHFGIGILFAIKYQDILEKNYVLNKWGVVLLGIIWIACGILKTYFDYYNFYVQELHIAIGIVFIWTLYDVLYDKVLVRLNKSWVLSTSFFIYLFHEPLLTFIKRGNLLVFNTTNQIVVFILYVISPIITILICIGVAYLLNRYCKPLYSVLTGGRTFEIKNKE